MENETDHKQTDFIEPVVILVKPQMGENIGATMRAMLNCGLKTLRLVAPRDGWPNEKAQAMSSGAYDKINTVEVFDTTEDAIADLQLLYATTAREREMNKTLFTAREAATDIQVQQKAGHKVGIVFGGERAGLDNEDIALCQNIIHIPLNPDFSSLNLGQAVLIVCYEVLLAQNITEYEITNKNDIADQQQMQMLYDRLEQELEKNNFFRTAETKPSILRNLKSALGRAQMSHQEVQTFHGVISALIGKKAPVRKRTKREL